MSTSTPPQNGPAPNEGARSRELHRYYAPWLETFHATELPLFLPNRASREDGHVPQSSSDKALTAFAQLGALRLRGKRSVVTLIDTESQMVLAEATQSLSLMDDEVHVPGDELWLGNAILPRGQGMSQFALRPDEYTARDPDGRVYTAPAMVIPDVTLHDDFKHKAFAGTGVTFYCGVPLVTKLGHPIGVYSVTDDKARPTLTTDELKFMTDMATVVIKHLEVIKNDRARARGERLIQGIASFIEGRSTDGAIVPDSGGGVPSVSKTASDAASPPSTKKGAKRPLMPRKKSSGGPWKGMTISDANKVGRENYPSHEEEEHIQSPKEHRAQQPVGESRGFGSGIQTSTGQDMQALAPMNSPEIQQEGVFERAAKILRRSLSADGVVFVDASSANLSQGAYKRERKNGTSESGKVSRTTTRDANPVTSLEMDASKDNENDDTLSSDNHNSKDGIDRIARPSLPCEVIAQSLLEKSSHLSLRLSQRNLHKLLRRYPNGRTYTFNEHGKLITSDVGSESTAPSEAGEETPVSPSKSQYSQQPQGKVHPLLSLLPGTRTIAFMPLWDYTRDRWHSAMILWSSNPAKLINIQDDLVYLTAFGNSIMNELARLNLLVSDSAKARFLANISHELRSPLHGILGSIEFLHESPLDDFQSNMVISVETCGKTLLDTVNHVLDFAKLNNLSKTGQRGITQATTSDSSLTSIFDLAVVVEEAVEAVYAGQVFRTANADALEGKGLPLASYNRAMQQRQDTKSQIAKGQAVMSSSVRLTLNIDGETNWLVSSQPGAIRRIIMNLLGNSLKYTEKGCIDVSLEVDRSREWEDDSHLHSCIVVTDTGQGMSEDFVKNHAFTAFSQENTLTSGTGLGLSIIRQIVDSLGGKIDMLSQKDIGTQVKIWLSLQSADVAHGDSALSQIRERVGGMSMCLLDPSGQFTPTNDVPPEGVSKVRSVGEALENLAHRWFSMHTFTAPNMTGRHTNFFVYPEPPPIEYLLHHHGENADGSETPVLIFCQNAFQANSLRANGIHHLTEMGRIIEVVAQPVGPQKLSKTLLRCLQRTKKLDKPSKAAGGKERVGGNVQPSDIIKTPGPQAQENQSERLLSSEDQHTKIPTTNLPSRPTLKHHATAPPARPSFSENETQRNPSIAPDVPSKTMPRVLVVDDNDINLQLLIAFVRKAKLPFESASNGLQALEAYKRAASSGDSHFKYVVMDISMPVMDGVTATREIRAFERKEGVENPAQIIALSGMGEENDIKEEARAAGFTQFLTKPIRFQVLRELLL